MKTFKCQYQLNENERIYLTNSSGGVLTNFSINETILTMPTYNYTANTSQYPINFSSLESLYDYTYNNLRIEKSKYNPLYISDYKFTDYNSGINNLIISKGYLKDSHFNLTPLFNNYTFDFHIYSFSQLFRKAAWWVKASEIFGFNIITAYNQNTDILNREIGNSNSYQSSYYIYPKQENYYHYENYDNFYNEITNLCGANGYFLYGTNIISINDINYVNLIRLTLGDKVSIINNQDICDLETSYHQYKNQISI